MDKKITCTASERGVAIIFALLAVLVLSLLAATVMFTSQGHTWTSLNYRMTTQSRYAAEAGVQKTMNWLSGASYIAPVSFASYDMTKNPVQYNGSPVVLSAVSGVSSNYPDAAVSSAYNLALGNQSLPGLANATFSTYATLLRMNPAGGVSWLSNTGGVIQTWQITSVGNVSGVTNSSVQVAATYERTGTPIFNYPIEATSYACKAINFQGGDYTDSYNSTNGPYSPTNASTSGGDIATNGNVNLGKKADIEGTIFVPNTAVGACPDGVTSSGSYTGIGKLPGPLNPPLPWGCTTTPCYPSPLPPTTSQSITPGSCGGIAGCTSQGTVSLTDGGKNTTANVFSLSPGSYGNVTINNADVIHLSAGTYNLNSLDFARDGQVVVDSGPVVINLAGQCSSGCPSEPGYNPPTSVLWGAGFGGMNACSGGVTANPDVYGKTTCGPSNGPFSGIPANLQIVYGGTDLIRLGGMPNAMVVYAPNAAYYTPGAPVGLYGSIVTGTFDDSSESPFHYDSALQNSVMQVGQYRPVGGFSWSKF